VATLFFSYSHVDENLRDQLEVHLAGLRRQGLIDSWHDRRITVGEDFGEAIDQHIDTADVILLLVSPDFIASDYCYEREMKRALDRHQRGDAKVIPVILRPCDWRDLPFGKLLATPKDGRPITKWANIDEAFQDVVAAIKGALKQHGQNAKPSTAGVSGAEKTTSTLPPRSSNLRITRQFTDLDKDRFRHEGFEYMANFFENSLQELVHRNPDLQQTFRRIDANRFTAAAYRNGEKVCRGSALLGGSTMGSESIEYSMTDEPRHGGMNEAVMVRADEEAIYFEALGMQSYGNSKERLTFQGAAEIFWELFIRPLQS
jgi:TIR domain-containing protein